MPKDLEVTYEDVPTNALVRRESTEPVRAEDFLPLLTVEQAVQRKERINEYISKVMREGEDYGPMPGDTRKEKKKVLLKPGAEKLSSIFGLAPKYIKETVIEDWTGREHGEPLFYYEYRCILTRGGRVAGEAIGSCNSWESKYRYRWVEAAVAQQRPDFKNLPIRGGQRTTFEPLFALEAKRTDGKYGKAPEYWQAFTDAIANKTAKFVEGRKLGTKEYSGWEITVDTTLYRIPNPDVADVINTCQKIAQKRALVAAVLVVTNCSDAFTQDVEDFGGDDNPPPASGQDEPPPQNGRASEQEPPQVRKAPEPPRPSTAETAAANVHPSGRSVPAELVQFFVAIDADSSRIKETFRHMENELVHRGGERGLNIYNDCVSAFREKHPRRDETKGEIKDLIIDMWEAAQKIETAVAS